MINKKNKYLFILILFLIFLSCENLKEKKYYYDTGELKIIEFLDSSNKRSGEYKEFFKSGKVKVKSRYLNGKLTDTHYEYFENGNVNYKQFASNNIDSLYIYTEGSEYVSKGELVNGDLIGWLEKFDTKTNRKVADIESIKVGNELIENQHMLYDSPEVNQFYELKLDDTLVQNVSYDVKFIFHTPIKLEKAYFCRGKNLTQNFDNIGSVKLDTVYAYPNENKIEFNFINSKLGKKRLRGFLEGGYYEVISIPDDSINVNLTFIKTRIYVNKEFTVIEDSM